MNNETMNNAGPQSRVPTSRVPTGVVSNPQSKGNGVGGYTDEFEPEITVFMCIYCAYMAADTAGALRIKYPANVKLVKLPCTGKTDTRYLLEAFEQGADGVCVVGCPIGNCHHVHGNERGLARVKYVKQMLDEIGLGSGRLEMYFVSGGMGNTFADAIREMTERVEEMGPNPLKAGDSSLRSE